jgi:thymidine phosphorylase
MVIAQGGDPSVLSHPETLLRARTVVPVRARKDGCVRGVRVLRLAQIANDLGAGRGRVDDVVDPSVGFGRIAKVGEHLSKGDLLCEVHTNQATALEELGLAVETLFEIGDPGVLSPPLVADVIR